MVASATITQPRFANPAALSEWRRREQARLRREVVAQLTVIANQLPDLSDTSADEYAAAAYPIVTDGQRAAAGIAARYGALLGAPGLAVPTIPAGVMVGALAAAGVLVTPGAGSLWAPVVRGRLELARGGALPQARGAVASLARALTSNDMQAAARVGVPLGLEEVGARARGWTKDADANACDWCQEIATRTYRTADDVPFHERDNCDVMPVLD